MHQWKLIFLASLFPSLPLSITWKLPSPVTHLPSVPVLKIRCDCSLSDMWQASVEGLICPVPARHQVCLGISVQVKNHANQCPADLQGLPAPCGMCPKLGTQNASHAKTGCRLQSGFSFTGLPSEQEAKRDREEGRKDPSLKDHRQG